jgi:hypothetical protein
MWSTPGLDWKSKQKKFLHLNNLKTQSHLKEDQHRRDEYQKFEFNNPCASWFAGRKRKREKVSTQTSHHE